MAMAEAGRQRRPRVAAVLEQFGATLSPCASIRLHGYLAWLHARGEIDFRTLLVEEVLAYRPDVIVWHRIALPTVAEVDALHALAALSGARLVYDIDDNLLDMEEHGEGEAYRGFRDAVLRSLQVADEVWCSTPMLSSRVAMHASGDVRVFENALDPGVWGEPAAPVRGLGDGATLRLLYMGTRTHDQDFAFLRKVVSSLVLHRSVAIRLTVVGVCQAPPGDAPWLDVRPPPGHVGASYPAFVHWLRQQSGFDLGVAPLIGGRFNDCKSAIKVLDYAAMGLPTLASDVPAYAGLAAGGGRCLLAGNEVEDWCETLARLHAEPDRLARVASRAASLLGEDVFADAARARLRRLEFTS
jgi:hypothetical protein